MQSKPLPLPARLVVLALTGYAAVTLLSLRLQLRSAEAGAAQLRQQLERAGQESAALEQAAADPDEGLAALARSTLGLVYEGEIVFRASGS